MKSVIPRALKATVYAALIAGTIDIGAACLINWLGPVVICHAIASGLLGRASFHEGAASAVLGLFLQWGMALVIAGVYVTAACLLPALARRWVAGGLAYGVVIFAVMNYLVVPLSAAAPPHYFTVEHLLHRFPPGKFVENLVAMLLFGLIVALVTHRLLGRPNGGVRADAASMAGGQRPAPG